MNCVGYRKICKFLIARNEKITNDLSVLKIYYIFVYH